MIWTTKPDCDLETPALPIERGAWGYGAAIFCPILVLALLLPGPALGQTKKAGKPVVLSPSATSYMVLKNVNIAASRDRPLPGFRPSRA